MIFDFTLPGITFYCSWLKTLFRNCEVEEIEIERERERESEKEQIKECRTGKSSKDLISKISWLSRRK